MNPLLDALGYVGASLDKPGRAVRGVLGGKPEESLAAIPFSDAMGLTRPENAVSGRALLEKLGVLGSESGVLGDVAGLGAEMALDPTNLVGAGLLKRTLGLRHAATESNAFREAILAHGGMPEEIAKLTRAVDAEGKPLKLFHGTGAVFDQYDLSKLDPNALYGPGVYLTDHPGIASEYATGRAEELQQKFKEIQDQIASAERRQAVRRQDLERFQSPPNPLESVRADSPGQDVDYMASRTLQDINHYQAEIEQLKQQLAAPATPAANVRAHYLDARDPFDVERFPLSEQESFLGAAASGKEHISNWLKESNYDALAYPGGRIAGDVPHQAYVVHDPSQLYAPWIAPAQQSVPRLSPLLTALGAYNAGARGGYPS